MIEPCEHKWVFLGVVYWADKYPLPGTGAHARIYGDRFFCERCLEQRTINHRTQGNTYEKPLDGTLPA